MLFLMSIVMTAPAEAGEVEIWRGEFPNDVYLDGEAGWSSGYDGDTWYGYQGNDGTFYGLPLSDDYEENGCERWSGACSNWLTNSAEDVTDGRFTVSIYSEDDDTIGIAFGQQSEDDYLLFVLCGDGDASCPLGDLGGQAALLHISGNSATVIDSARASYDQQTNLVLSVTSDDGTLNATYGNTNLRGDMPDGRALNAVGLYSYNAGYADRSNVYFWDALLYALDTDDDSVIDDADNCEDAANPDQTDEDGDGLGAACDDNDAGNGGGDNGGGDNGGGDTAPGTDDTSLDDGAGVGGSEELKIAGGCACSSASGQAGLAFGALALVGLAGLRRRD